MTSVSRERGAAGPVARRFPARADTLRDIRHFVADLAAAAGIGDEVHSAVVLAVHEAAANAVEHSGGDAVTVRWEHRDGEIDVAVHDNGIFQEVRRCGEGRGRGLGILLGLADAVMVRPGRPDDLGTRVRLTFYNRGLRHPAAHPTGGRGRRPRTANAPRTAMAAAARPATAVRAPRPGRPVLPDLPGWVAQARRMLLDHLPVGYALFDRQLRFLEINDILADMNGLPVEAHLGRRVHEVLPAAADVLVRRFRRVLETGRPLREAEVSTVLPGVPGVPGTARHWLHSVYPVPGPEGVPAGLAVLVRETTELRTAQQAAAARVAAECDASRLRLLQRLTATLGSALDTTQVARLVTTTVPAELGADGAALGMADAAGTCWPLAVSGLTEAELAIVRSRQTPGADPLTAVFRASGPVLIRSRADWDRQFPTQRGTRAVFQALAFLPLRTGDTTLGVVTFGWREPRDFTGDEVDLLTAVATQTAVAMERARLYDAEHDALRSTRLAERRLALLAEASAQLAAGTAEADQLGRLGDLLVREFADHCAILLADECGVLRRHTVRSRDPRYATLAAALHGTEVDMSATHDPRAATWHTGRTQRWRLTDATAFPGGLPADQVRQVVEGLGTGWGAAALLVARGQRLGAFTVWRSGDAPPFDEDDAQLLTDLGRRAGTAIDNTRLLAARTHVAMKLQDTLLPARLPAIDGVELAPRYLTAEDAAAVVGDLYDVFAVGDGSYALVIGDVSGRGVDAAGLTGLTRATLRALAGLPVDTALARLNALLAERTGSERFLTLAYLLLRPDADGADLQVWLAGHPQPALVRATGGVEALGVPGTLLGILPAVTHTPASYRLTPGDLLLLYTDGLTEARGPDGMFGTAQLPALLADLVGCPASTAVGRVEQAVAEHRRGSADDAAMLAVRLTPLAEPREQLLLELRTAADPAEIPGVAAAVAGCTGSLAPADRVGAVAEAVAEVLHHASRELVAATPRSLRPDPVQLRVLRRGDAVRIEISWPGPRSATAVPHRAAEGILDRLRLPAGVVADLDVGTGGVRTGIRLEVCCHT